MFPYRSATVCRPRRFGRDVTQYAIGLFFEFRAWTLPARRAVVSRQAIPYNLPPLRRRAPLEAGAFVIQRGTSDD